MSLKSCTIPPIYISVSSPTALLTQSLLYLSYTACSSVSTNCFTPLIPMQPAAIICCPASITFLLSSLKPCTVTVTTGSLTEALTVVCPPAIGTSVTAACLVSPAITSLIRISLACSGITMQSLAAMGVPPAAYILLTALIRGIYPQAVALNSVLSTPCSLISTSDTSCPISIRVTFWPLTVLRGFNTDLERIVSDTLPNFISFLVSMLFTYYIQLQA